MIPIPLHVAQLDRRAQFAADATLAVREILTKHRGAESQIWVYDHDIIHLELYNGRWQWDITFQATKRNMIYISGCNNNQSADKSLRILDEYLSTHTTIGDLTIVDHFLFDDRISAHLSIPKAKPKPKPHLISVLGSSHVAPDCSDML